MSEPASPVRSRNRISHGLVALGTGAVLAVYSAGYLRTRAAADLLDAADARRLPPPPPAIHEALPVLDVQPPPAAEEARLASGPPDVPAVPAGASPAVTTAALARNADRGPAAPPPVVPSAVPPTSDVADSTPAGPPVAAAGPIGDVASTPAAAEASVEVPPAETAAVSSTPTIADAVTTSALAAAPETGVAAAIVAPPAESQYKDGSYSGWGTSRHGDIEATVVIEGGRIASARISKCWTRYPCSWIAKLPPQVAERQSPEVDYVSGATQSTNAFYYAVVEALRKAK